MIWAPFIVLAVVLFYGFVHSLFASLGVKARAERWWGERARRGYRLAYNIFAILSFVPVLALAAALPDRLLYTIPRPWSFATLALQGAAAVTILVGVLQTGVGSFLGVSQLFEPSGGSPPALVAHGLYRWVRHPLYTAGLVFIWLALQMSANLLALNLGLTIYLVLGAIVEERKLVHEFGQAYRDYRRRTPMLIPKPPAPALYSHHQDLSP
jgi:protein-S-isoprenylcysteine O-methyltransferase Ste14